MSLLVICKQLQGEVRSIDNIKILSSYHLLRERQRERHKTNAIRFNEKNNGPSRAL